MAKVKKELSFLRPRFSIVSSEGDFDVEGGFMAHNFTVSKNGRVAATIDKKVLAFTDTYEAKVENSENQPLILALVIVIDQIIHDNN